MKYAILKAFVDFTEWFRLEMGLLMNDPLAWSLYEN